MNTPRYQHLQQLGIPVWQLRAQAPEATVSEEAAVCEQESPLAIDISWRSQPVGLCLAEPGSDQKLLHAMLDATRCQWKSSELSPLDDELPGVPATLIFGLSLAQSLLPDLALTEADLGSSHALPSGSVFITHAVNNIITNPALKKSAWATIQQAMKLWHSR